MIGARPALGRDFLPEEDRPGARRVAILGDGLWKRRFGGQPNVLNRSMLLDRQDYTIVGVMSPSFDLDPADVYLPIAHSGARVQDMPAVGVYGRLKRGVSLATAQADIDQICRGWIAEHHYPQDWGARGWILHDYMVRGVRSSILVLAAAVALVLLIACANVANLLLARAGARRREIAIRIAMGAGRGRIIRQLLTESAVLAIVSAIAGVLLAWAATRAIAAAETAVPFSRHISVDAFVLLFTTAAALVTTLLFGIAPALAAARPNVASRLQEGGRGAGEGVRRTRVRAALVVAEVALALLLVIGAALTMRSLFRLLSVDPGFRPQSVLTADIMLPQGAYASPAARIAFFDSLLDRMSSTPGVQAAGMVSDLPFGGSKSGNDVIVEGGPPPRSGDRNIAFVRAIDPGFFPALQVRLLRGRLFSRRDSSSPPPAIVNEAMARRCWPGQDPVGRRFAPGSESGRPPVWLTVVGVVADMRNTSLTDAPDLEYYLPYAVSPAPHMALVFRTSLDPAKLAPALRAAVRGLDHALPVSDVSTLAESIDRSTSTHRLSASLLGAFAFLALLLASVGIYGVISYSVARRTREIGIRMALGAAPRGITAIVVGRAVLLGAIGVAIGLAGSFALTRLLRGMLFGVSATDPAVFAAASLFLLAVCAIAAYPPARRAAHVDPVEALHHE